MSQETLSRAIEKRTVYVTPDGAQHDTPEAAFKNLENCFELYFRQGLYSIGPLPPKDQIRLIEWILEHRETLRKLLDF